MKTDPRAACANLDERFVWALVHDGIAHPFMALTFYSAMSIRLHDWTSLRAWPRANSKASPEFVIVPSARYGSLLVSNPAVGIFSIKHPVISHTLTTQAGDFHEAVEKAEAWFATIPD